MMTLSGGVWISPLTLPVWHACLHLAFEAIEDHLNVGHRTWRARDIAYGLGATQGRRGKWT